MNQRRVLGLLILSTCSYLSAQSCADAGKGKLVTDFALNSKLSKTVGVQANGKTIVARIKEAEEDGVKVNVIHLERFSCTGTKDFEFGDNGSVKADIHPISPKNMVQLSADGKIVLAGSDGVRLRRYTQDGDLDKSFGVEGVVEGAFTIKDDRELKNETVAIRVQSDGKILVAGNATRSMPPYNVLYFLARFNSNGTVDKKFGDNGKIIEGESERNTPEIIVENVLTDMGGTIFLIGQGKSSPAKKNLVLHKFSEAGQHIKGPVNLSLEDNQKSPFKISDSILANDSELVFLAERENKLALLRFNTDLEFDPNFKYEPKKEFASGRYEANSVGAVPNGYVITARYGAGDAKKDSEMQIIKVNASGKELIRLTDNNAESTNEFPARLLQEPNGKYSLLSSNNGTFSAEGLEYILLKFVP